MKLLQIPVRPESANLSTHPTAVGWVDETPLCLVNQPLCRLSTHPTAGGLMKRSLTDL